MLCDPAAVAFQNIRLFRGFARGKEINLDGGLGNTDLRQMVVDEVVTDSRLTQDVPCQGCGRCFQQLVWRWRCGKCSLLPWPHLTVYARCHDCGGERKLEYEIAAHMKDAHGL